MIESHLYRVSRLVQGGLIALLLLLGMGPPPRLVVVGPQPQVQTANPKMGVHTRLTDEVEEWKVKRTLEMVRGVGAPWIVEFFPWAYYEPEKGVFHWDHPDMVIEHALAQGLTVIARLGLTPAWARSDPAQGPTPLTYLDETRYDDFADFAVAFVERYRGRVAHVIVWNEPNLSFEWGQRPVDPESYIRLLRAVYPRVKAANPDVRVLAGALAPTLAPSGHPEGMDDLVYLQRMYDAGAARFFDILAAHTYGLKFPPDDAPAADKINFRRVELLRQVMVDNGDADKPVYITETGWNDHPRWTKAVRPYARMEYTIGAYDWALRHWDWCPAIVMWAFRYPWDAKSFQDYFTFVGVDFRPKPIYLQVQRYARGERGVDDGR
ncbi:MAG: hypothetical protein JSV36_09430 [Anaerolineae bacterium]|nr:MAG: hypothetical protein JSV36_09430 [Anaerolineae bacterium]